MQTELVDDEEIKPEISFISLYNLKRNLCCPMVFTWLVFISELLNFIEAKNANIYYLIGTIISCILSFMVALFVTLSAFQGSPKKYLIALYLGLASLIEVCLYVGISLFIFMRDMNEVGNIVQFDEFNIFTAILAYIIVVFSAIYIILESIKLCVLCCYKKAFDVIPLPYNQPLSP